MNVRYSINPRVGWRNIDSEITIFNCENQQIAIWNETASFLWEKMKEGVGFSELVEFLANEYSISKKIARKDIIAFFQEASSCGFINYTDSGLKAEKLKSQGQDSEEGKNVLLNIEMKAIEKLIPFAVTFETTYACNERCIHCYMDRNRKSLSLDEIKRILEEIAAAGCLFVSFTGGEFLLVVMH